MNNTVYPPWWNTTVTIYNKFQDPITRRYTWYRTVIKGTFWKYIGDKITVGQTVLETNNIICRIRKDDRFLPKHEWVNIPNDKMKNYFTIGKGDIIVKGEVTDTIDEEQKGHRSNDLLAKYKQLQGCMSVEETAINIGEGRCTEHYLAKGV